MGKFHAGELEVQRRAGIDDEERLGRGIRDRIPLGAQDFLASLPLIMLTTVASDGAPWISPLFGLPGFVRLVDDRTISVHSTPRQGDRWVGHLQANPMAGLLAMDFARRSRLRINGSAALEDGGLRLRLREFYANCPQYIQARSLANELQGAAAARAIASAGLSPEQAARISSSDTFFLGTVDSRAGADASHRGGRPGFVRVESESRLTWPDYPGNQKFQSLGNIHSTPAAALLFIDYQTGATLQLGGTAAILWDSPRLSEFPGAQRLVQFDIGEVVEVIPAQPLRWDFLEASPFNP